MRYVLPAGPADPSNPNSITSFQAMVVAGEEFECLFPRAYTVYLYPSNESKDIFLILSFDVT